MKSWLIVKLKDGIAVEDVELALGEMCNVVKNTYGDGKGGLHRWSGI